MILQHLPCYFWLQELIGGQGDANAGAQVLLVVAAARLALIPLCPSLPMGALIHRTRAWPCTSPGHPTACKVAGRLRRLSWHLEQTGGCRWKGSVCLEQAGHGLGALPQALILIAHERAELDVVNGAVLHVWRA